MVEVSFGQIVLWVVYFLSLYFSVFWLLVYVEKGISPSQNKKKQYGLPLVTIAIPAYNEQECIVETLSSVVCLNYPLSKMEIFVVDDGSTDNTYRMVLSFMKEHPHLNIRLLRQKNQGKAVALNNALRSAQGEFFVCFDADSCIDSNALKHILPDFDDPHVAVSLPLMKTRGAINLLQRMQTIEYLINAFYKRVMETLDCIHVAPGPFSVYRTSIVKKLGGWDEGNITEDLEMALRLQKYGYKIIQNMQAVVYTVVPENINAYYYQRNRWFKGGVLNAIKHRKMMLNPKYGDFGIIQMPVLIISGVLSITLLLTTIYYFFKPYIIGVMHMGLVGFDFLTFIRTLEFNFDILNISYANVIVFIITIFISLFIIYLTHIYTKEHILGQGIFTLVLFMFSYFFLLGYVWLGIVKDFILGKKQRW